MDVNSSAIGAARDPQAMPHLDYFGGKVLEQPKFFSLFVGKFWKSPQGRLEANYQNRFAKYVLKSPYTKIWNEYGVGKGKFLGSKTIGLSKAEVFSDAKIQALLRKELTSPSAPTSDGQTVYTFYLPPDAILETPEGETSLNGLGGYHSSMVGKNGRKIYYSVLVYSEDGNGIDFTGDSKRNMTIAASHEWSEAVTDPDVNSGRLGWYDERYGEVADIPMSLGLPLAQTFGEIGGYAVQKEWSNRDLRLEVQPLRVRNRPVALP